MLARNSGRAVLVASGQSALADLPDEVGTAEVQCGHWTSAACSQDPSSLLVPHEEEIGSGLKSKWMVYSPSEPSNSAPINQHTKVSRLRPRQRMGLFFCGSRWRIKIRRAQEQVVRLRIDLHRLGPVLGLDLLDLAELVRRILVENVDHAFAGRDKQQTRCRLKDGSVHPSSDGERLNDFSVVRIHHHHELRAAARGKEAPVLYVHCQRDSLPFRSDRPAVLYLESFGVNGHYVVFIFVIVVDHPLAVDCGELHRSDQVYVLHYRFLRRIDNG